MGVSEAVLHVSGRLQWPARALAPVYPRLQVAGRRCHLGLAHFAAGLRVESRSPMLACLPPLAHVPTSHHLPATVPAWAPIADAVVSRVGLCSSRRPISNLPLLAPRRIYPSHPATLRLILPPPPPLSALSHPNDIRMSPCPGLYPMSSHDARRGPASNPSPANIRPRPATRLRLLVCPPPSTTWPSQTQSSEDRRSTGAAARPSPTPRKPNFPPPPSRRGAIISGGSDIVPNIHDTCEDRLSVGVITVTHRPHVARNMAITTLYHIILAPRPAVIHTV